MPDQPTTRLYLLRHAEVEEKFHQTFGGHLDIDLSPEGHKQAEALAGYLKEHSFDAIYASPMRRVQQTLKELLKCHDLEATMMEGLREVHFGVWTGLKWHEVKEKHDRNAYDWLEHLEAGEISEAETGASFRARVEPCLKEILENHAGESIAIACHGGVIRMLLSILLKLQLPQTNAFDISYASVTQVNCRPHRSEVQLLNFTPWRDRK